MMTRSVHEGSRVEPVRSPGASPDVCHLTTTHRAVDNRIFDCEAASLARAGLAVAVIGLHHSREERLGVTILPLVGPGSAPPSRPVRAWRALSQALEVGARAYHVHEPELLAVGVMLRIAGRRVVYDVHEDVKAQVRDRCAGLGAVGRAVAAAWGVFEVAASRLLSAVIVVDSHLAARFAACKPVVVSNFPSSAFWEGGRRVRHGGEFRISYVGGVTEARGLGVLLDALELVRGDVVLHVIGDVPNSPLGARLRAHPRVLLQGRVPWAQVAGHLANADLGVALLQPVRAYLEVEYVVKVFEYLSVGVPVLLSDFPKLRRQVEEIGYGRVVDPTDPAAVAAAIEDLRDHPEVRRAMGERGRQAVQQRFNWEREEIKLLALYRRLLPGTDAAAEGVR